MLICGWVQVLFSTNNAALNFINAGASFIVSPCFVDEVFQVCRQHDVPYLPGCMTVKEIFEAGKAGLQNGQGVSGQR